MNMENIYSSLTLPLSQSLITLPGRSILIDTIPLFPTLNPPQ
jgi:hypothetical protein